MAKAYVYDYETVANCFLGVFINVKNPKDIIVFEVSDTRNQIILSDLIMHLKL